MIEPDELEQIRQQVESFDTIGAIDPKMRGDRRTQLAALGIEAAAFGR